MGPILIFDKSTLQSLSADEALWLHLLYSPNLTPVFLVETLGDLQKEVGKGRTPEEVVGGLASKSLLLGDRLNVHHETLCRTEILGRPVEMSRLPVISGNETVVTGNRSGIIFRESVEAEAINRWRRREFLEVERRFARKWRASMAGLDLSYLRAVVGGARKPRTLSEARDLAIRAVNREGKAYSTINREISVLRHALRLAARWKTETMLTQYRLTDWTPLREAETARKAVFLTGEQVEAVIGAAHVRAVRGGLNERQGKAVVRLALETGARLSASSRTPRTPSAASIPESGTLERYQAQRGVRRRSTHADVSSPPQHRRRALQEPSG